MFYDRKINFISSLVHLKSYHDSAPVTKKVVRFIFKKGGKEAGKKNPRRLAFKDMMSSAGSLAWLNPWAALPVGM